MQVFEGQGLGAVLNFNLARIEYDNMVLEMDKLQTSEDENEVSTYLIFDEIIDSKKSEDGSDDALNTTIEKARAYAKRLSATLKSSPQGHAFINGKHSSVSDVSYYGT